MFLGFVASLRIWSPTGVPDSFPTSGMSFVAYWEPQSFCRQVFTHDPIELAHNFLPSASSGFFPFHKVHGHPLSLFRSTDPNFSVPPDLSLVCRCKRTWELTCQHLLRQSTAYKAVADRKRSSARNHTTKNIWLLTKNLTLRVKSCRFIGPFPKAKIIHPVSVHLRIPRSMRVHLTFHISHVKPALTSLHLTVSSPVCYLTRQTKAWISLILYST